MQFSALFFELPPISGHLRAFFYGGLLLLCILDYPSPMQAPRIVGSASPLFYTPPRILCWLGSPLDKVALLRAVRALTVVAWVGAALGLLQPLTGVLVFLGFAFLHAANSGALGANHSTHSALYALFAMCFSVSDDFSLDMWLRERTDWPRLVPAGSVLESGFARELLLVSMVYVMLAGGVAKLRNGGSSWFTGRMLRYYIAQAAPNARSPWVSRQLRARPRLCQVLATGTVFVEASGVLALADPKLIPYVVLAWVGLHVGILLVMAPLYLVQIWCYMLLVDWHSLLGIGGVAPWMPRAADQFAMTALTIFGAVFGLTLAIVFLRHSEEWPFTSVPMYSNGTPPDERRLPARGELRAKAVAAKRGDVNAWHRPWVPGEGDEELRIIPAGGGAPRPLFDLLAEHGATPVRWSQWTKVVRRVAIDHVAARPADEPAATAIDYPGPVFLLRLAAFVRERLPRVDEYRRIDMVVRTAEGPLVIGSAELNNVTSPLAAQRGCGGVSGSESLGDKIAHDRHAI
jgi:hypothetical protein